MAFIEMELIEYDEKYRQDFIDFNTACIEDNFGHLEPEDYETFEHIKIASILEVEAWYLRLP